MREDLPAVQLAFDLAKELFIRVGKFPKEYRFTLGDKVALTGMLVLNSLIEATYSKNKTPILDKTNIRLEQLRYMLRLSRELGPLSNKGYEHVSRMVDDLGRQVGGWRKQAGGS